MKAVILAGGLGTRLSEETDRIPKPMVQIGGRPILWHIMKLYSHHGVNEFVVCLGYKGYVVKEFFANYCLHMSDLTFDLAGGHVEYDRRHAEPWRVTLVDTGAGTQTGGRLRRVAHLLQDGPFCMTYGDGISNVDIASAIRFHRQHGRRATVTAVAPPGRFGLMEMRGNRVASFAEKADNSHSLINGGYFVLDPGVLEYIDGDDTVWERAPMERLAAEGELLAFDHQDFWRPMDTLRDKRSLDELWEAGEAPWKVWA